MPLIVCCPPVKDVEATEMKQNKQLKELDLEKVLHNLLLFFFLVSSVYFVYKKALSTYLNCWFQSWIVWIITLVVYKMEMQFGLCL